MFLANGKLFLVNGKPFFDLSHISCGSKLCLMHFKATQLNAYKYVKQLTKY